MPTYVYECAKCGEEVEAWQSFTDAPLKKHSGCGGRLHKVLQPVGIVFKGSGFHRTDSRAGGKRSRDDSSGKDGKDGSGDSTSSKDGKSESSSSDDKKKPVSDPKAATKKTPTTTASG
jgi:putative FmdB family regulatory protein